MSKQFIHQIYNLGDHIICLNYGFYGWFQFFFTTIAWKTLFEPVWNQVSIQEALFFIIKYKFQILILHIQKYFLTNFQYGITSSCVDNKIYIWCSGGCHGEPHLGTEPLPRKLR